MKYPKSLADLIDSFSLFPGVGPKTAERLALFAIQKMSKDNVKKFSDNLLSAYENIKRCSICGSLCENETCDICEDIDRDNVIMVVETTKDVIVFEKIGQYHGRYHVLNGLISPLNGVGPDDIGLNKLIERVQKEKVKEVIVCTSANIDGEMTALYIKGMLDEVGVECYRIGYGLPAGGDIEYADEVTLLRALEGKKKM